MEHYERHRELGARLVAAGVLSLVCTGVLNGCADADDTAPAARDAPDSATIEAEIPSDATLPDFCYAVNGIRYLADGTEGSVIQERVAALAETGTTPQAPAGAAEAIAALRQAVDELGTQVTVDDLDPVEASHAPSPFDDPESGLVEWAEEDCDGVYTDDFSTEGQSEDEDVIDNQLWLRDEYLTSGECDRLAELYTQDSDIEYAIGECASGSAVPYDAIGGGVTGPDSADVIVQIEDGSQYTMGVRVEDDTWKLTLY